MDTAIITQPLSLALYGFSGVAVNREYGKMAFQLSGRMWQTVKSADIKNKGINIWVYETGHKVFAGVELTDTPARDSGLEQNHIVLENYAYYKHIGPYQLIGQSGEKMRAELKAKGYETTLPYIEMYGHWTEDETKLETELLMALKSGCL